MQKNEIYARIEPKKTELGERLAKIRTNLLGGNTEKLSQILGIHYTNVAKTIKGDYTLKLQSIENLLNALPEINPDWLLLGKGPMLRDEIVTNITTNNGNVAGINNGTQTCAEAGVVAKLSDTIATQQRTIEQQNEHIATLLSLLAKKQ